MLGDDDISEGAAPRTRRRNKDLTVAELKAAATRQLVSEGLANLSVKPIIEKAGVSRGALFHHFPTKNHLIAAAFADLLDGAANDLHRLGHELRENRISIDEFVSGVRGVFCSEMFVGSMEIAIGIRVDAGLTELVRDSLEKWWASLARFWVETFDLPTMSKSEADQHWVMASNLLRGHAFSSSYSGSPNLPEPFCEAFKAMILTDAVVRSKDNITTPKK
ncbi:TetR/AcrR family transcriptional regulator [Hoeflea prorocentri]|uniref:TetR/AcrR family transcriptional regulator n=1 Tax=Hoeflea prorocentri TaxID=1922333 RepID=A0A9X3UIY4_9HYPH|nr:TetR/AcrR family transcriptional regulator [Hoeflea prorocentri]MCY6382202.1 TetR/AcrR family transcriptional regulator [Hoeflea prorocentri]MDA5400002.1 TetR/AcrR family transcriptional regulator [Hoeflea prorocentri]